MQLPCQKSVLIVLLMIQMQVIQVACNTGSPKYVWTRTEMNAVAPLLEAYQENLDEKDELINNYKKNLEHFTIRYKEILAENESLHEQLVEANKKVIM